jgi:hypothetical protein
MSDIWQQWEQARAAPPPLPRAIAQLIAQPAALPDPASIPPREWLYGTRLVRRFVSLLIAPGGVGKTALALGQAAAVASGRGFLGEKVHHTAPAWVLNLEDPLDELNRRLAALMLHHKLDRAALEGRLFLNSGRTRRVTMASLSEDRTGVVHPDREAVIQACLAGGIGLLVVDPFVKSHGVDENDNAQIDAAATAWAEVAEATGAAVLLVHHVRKGGGETVDIEASRGAKALSDAARAAAVLTPMSEEEALRLSVPVAERWRHVRLDDAKANLAPRGETALWYRLETVDLGNATPAYPAGDHVAAIAPWRRPAAVPASMTPARCNAVLDRIAQGPGTGLRYSAHRGGAAGAVDRWAGRVLIDGFGLGEAEAVRLIGVWVRSGLLIETAYRDAAQRKTRMGLQVNDTLRPTVPRDTAAATAAFDDD